VHIEKTYVLVLAADGSSIELQDSRPTDEPEADAIRLTVPLDVPPSDPDKSVTLWLTGEQLRELVAAANEILDRADADDLLILHGKPRRS
jgi:hypothetical protein